MNYKNTHLMAALESHKKWLVNPNEGKRFCWEEIRYCFSYPADLSHADLKQADLSSTNLEYANLEYADLRGADLRRTNLSQAVLRSADLRYANLNKANLAEVNLARTNLSNASLIDTDLRYASLEDADLNYSIFTGANLKYAKFYYATLNGVDLRGANLLGIDFTSAYLNDIIYDETTSFFALTCPEVGSYRAFKKSRDKIIELEIPADALRSSATTRKCRASKAKVLAITELDGTPSEMDSISSNYNKNFIYKVGEIVEVKNFDINRWKECSTGIHHFMTRQEAVNYF